MPLKAKAYIGAVLLSGFAILATAALHWHSADYFRFFFYLAVAMLSSRLKVVLPGITATMSVNFLFILVGIVKLTLPETLIIGCAATTLQLYWNAEKRPKLVQGLFNLCSTAVAVAAAYQAFHMPLPNWVTIGFAVHLVAAGTVYFLCNTLQVSAVISLTEGKSVLKIWSECYFWSFPYYLAGAALAGLITTSSRFLSLQSSVLLLPVVFWIYRSYQLYLDRFRQEKERAEEEKRHSQDIADLHLRTIEALAMAIDAKDEDTREHLQRVQTYAVELGRELGLSEMELEALRAAALLHDIGKLAVPEHILSKPGRLTPEEFEKMKIHPVVGAEILERINFPYPVVPIVRHHHEKWNGNGYPDGLKGEEIPIGARILSALDCLDAVASDRKYRKALPLDQAMQVVVDEAGVSFDPRIVDLLKRRYLELEQLVRSQRRDTHWISSSHNPRHMVAPAAGFEVNSSQLGAFKSSRNVDFLSSIADARQEAQALFELSQTLGSSLSMDDTLSVMASRLRRLIEFDSIAVFTELDNVLLPEFVAGVGSSRLSSLQIPVGEGLCGWVAMNRKPIINGNPAVEPGGVVESISGEALQSALCVPLEGVDNVIGVLALYNRRPNAFSKDNLRVLMAVSSKIALSIENAIKFKRVEQTATIDYMTSLPNARSLFMHLESELARATRSKTSMCVLVCDLDDFKTVNDKFGHLVGNKVLERIAKRLRAECREYDYLARMGGDEFVAVLPGLTTELVKDMMKRFQRITAETALEICGAPLFSLSVGQAIFPDDGTDAEQLLAKADRRMYVHKSQSKNAKQTMCSDIQLEAIDPSTTRIC